MSQGYKYCPGPICVEDRCEECGIIVNDPEKRRCEKCSEIQANPDCAPPGYGPNDYALPTQTHASTYSEPYQVQGSSTSYARPVEAPSYTPADTSYLPGDPTLYDENPATQYSQPATYQKVGPSYTPADTSYFPGDPTLYDENPATQYSQPARYQTVGPSYTEGVTTSAPRVQAFHDQSQTTGPPQQASYQQAGSELRGLRGAWNPGDRAPTAQHQTYTTGNIQEPSHQQIGSKRQLEGARGSQSRRGRTVLPTTGFAPCPLQGGTAQPISYDQQASGPSSNVPTGQAPLPTNTDGATYPRRYQETYTVDGRSFTAIRTKGIPIASDSIEYNIPSGLRCFYRTGPRVKNDQSQTTTRCSNPANYGSYYCGAKGHNDENNSYYRITVPTTGRLPITPGQCPQLIDPRENRRVRQCRRVTAPGFKYCAEIGQWNHCEENSRIPLPQTHKIPSAPNPHHTPLGEFDKNYPKTS